MLIPLQIQPFYLLPNGKLPRQNPAIREVITNSPPGEPRAIRWLKRFTADSIKNYKTALELELAEEQLKFCQVKYEKTTPKLSGWMEENLPEGLTVFALPESHRKRMCTTNMLE